jgi:LytS/YehU family sensor histidine kinase
VNEVNHVAEAFNDMKHSIHHYISELQKQKQVEQDMMNERIRNMKMEQMLKRMELYTMQAQMNPHFLFNTLNTGVQLAIIEDADRTAEFMENLANLFRHNLKDRQFFIPLRHEVDGLKSYLDILKIRFPKTRRFELDVENSLLDQCLIPSMVVQPLVENSVLHAFKDNPEEGVVEVRIFRQIPYLMISVKDNGSGIPSETVERLLKPQIGDYSVASKVMGLENVIQRCYFFYPDDKKVIKILTAPGEGTEILIRIHTEAEPCIRL